jgi:hypothetical protein
MLSFTLDTNCVIAVDEGRQEGAFVLQLADAHARSDADVAVVAIMSSEKQRHGGWLEDFREFQKRLEKLGLGHLSLCSPMAYWDICFWDHCLWSGEEERVLEEKVHQILFPSVEFILQDFCRNRGVPATPIVWNDITHAWRNAKCDVQAVWSHTNAHRDVFVTSDGNFHQAAKKQALLDLGAGRIERPEQASALL